MARETRAVAQEVPTTACCFTGTHALRKEVTNNTEKSAKTPNSIAKNPDNY